jgi:ankyrin repeat protein
MANESRQMILINACAKGNAEDVIKAVENGADVDGVVLFGHETPLYVAARGNYADVVDVLIKMKAHVNKARLDNGESPLYIASKNGFTDVIEKLLDAGANVTQETKEGMTSLSIALALKRFDIANQLCRKKTTHPARLMSFEPKVEIRSLPLSSDEDDNVCVLSEKLSDREQEHVGTSIVKSQSDFSLFGGALKGPTVLSANIDSNDEEDSLFVSRRFRFEL